MKSSENLLRKGSDSMADFSVETPEIFCALDPLGASIARVLVLTETHGWIDVAMAPDRFDPSVPDPALAGRTIGPCCGRIRDGEIQIGEKRYALTQNEGENHIHGGPGGCAFAHWEGRQLGLDRVVFSLSLDDGQDGYPGCRRLQAEYYAVGRTLSVRYTAVTDRETFLDMTNHVYWDLSGRFDGSALDQMLEIASRQVVLNDDHHLPFAIASSDNAFDFRCPCSIREKLSAYQKEPQLLIGRGYNNAFLLDDVLRREMSCSGRLFSPSSDLSMWLRTNAPCLVFYSGGFLESPGPPVRSTPGKAVALEAQQVPDSFHLPGVTTSVLLPGQVFLREIFWEFKTSIS